MGICTLTGKPLLLVTSLIFYEKNKENSNKNKYKKPDFVKLHSIYSTSRFHSTKSWKEEKDPLIQQKQIFSLKWL